MGKTKSSRMTSFGRANNLYVDFLLTVNVVPNSFSKNQHDIHQIRLDQPDVKIAYYNDNYWNSEDVKTWLIAFTNKVSVLQALSLINIY